MEPQVDIELVRNQLEEIARRYRLSDAACPAETAGELASQAEWLRLELERHDDPAVFLTADHELRRRAQEARTYRQRADWMRRRWSAIFTDGLEDVLENANHDLHRRMRALTAEFEQQIDQADLAADGGRIGRAVHDGIDEALHRNAVLIMQGAMNLARCLAAHFDNQLDGLAGLNAQALRPTFELSNALSFPGTQHRRTITFDGASGSAFGLSLSGIGLGMAGLVLDVAGSVIVMALAVVVGLFSGGMMMREQREQDRALRRTSAKKHLRRRVEDVLFHESKLRRDAVLHWSRAVREALVVAADNVQAQAVKEENAAAALVPVFRDESDQWWESLQVDLAELRRLGDLATTDPVIRIAVPAAEAAGNDDGASARSLRETVTIKAPTA